MFNQDLPSYALTTLEQAPFSDFACHVKAIPKVFENITIFPLDLTLFLFRGVVIYKFFSFIMKI